MKCMVISGQEPPLMIDDPYYSQIPQLNRMKELERKIQEEICRLQLIDYPSTTSNDYLHKLQSELKVLKTTPA